MKKQKQTGNAKLQINQLINQFILPSKTNANLYNEQQWQDNKAVKCTNSYPRKTQVKSD